MWRNSLCTVGAFVLALFGASSVGAVGPNLKPSVDAGTIVQPVHSLYEAERTLYRRGYHDVQVERTSLPYSFNACKRGVRYHIHVDYYGDLVQVDALGRCRENGYGYYGQRRYDDNGYYGRRRYYEGYRYREPY